MAEPFCSILFLPTNQPTQYSILIFMVYLQVNCVISNKNYAQKAFRHSFRCLHLDEKAKQIIKTLYTTHRLLNFLIANNWLIKVQFRIRDWYIWFYRRNWLSSPSISFGADSRLNRDISSIFFHSIFLFPLNSISFEFTTPSTLSIMVDCAVLASLLWY